jgi:DNA-damage-inducible protein D
MKANKSQRKSISIFEKHKKTDKAGNEYWSAKDLAKVLGYSTYSLFIEVLDTRAFCINSGQQKASHLHYQRICP